MIDRIVIKNFKSFRNVDLKLGRMNLFIGANASGKSNFLDALRFLQGIGLGMTISEILDGKPRTPIQEVWKGIRGGSRYACFAGAENTDEITIEVYGKLTKAPERRWEYRIAFSPGSGTAAYEHLSVESEWYTYSGDDHSLWRSGNQADEKERSSVDGPRYRPILGTKKPFPECPKLTDVIDDMKGMFASIQQIDLEPRTLREYSDTPNVIRLGERGEDFASLVQTICSDERRKGAYLSWIQELRPDQVNDVGTVSGAVGDSLFMLRENGWEFPARALSEGTLRFAAMTAAFFQPEMPDIMTIEEIDNGIYPSRLGVLVELLRSLPKLSDTQVFAATHSPTLLEWLDPGEYGTTFLCVRPDTTGESTILPLTDVPHFNEVIKKAHISDLLMEGWMEMVF